MPVTTRAAATRARHELLWEVLRTGPCLRLNEKDLVSCMLTCKAMRSLAYRHVVDVDYDRPDVQKLSWWRPEELCCVEEAYLHPCTIAKLPALHQLQELVLLGAPPGDQHLLDLTPLSSLRLLKKLIVDTPATGVHALPPISTLRLDLGTAQDLQALASHTQLTGLALYHEQVDAGCVTFQAADFAAVCSLPQLQVLQLRTLHLPPLAGGGSLSACRSLRTLELNFSPCSCLTAATSLASLSSLTQLTCLNVCGAAPEDYHNLDRLPWLRVLELLDPDPFAEQCRERGLPLPRFNVALLKLSFLYTMTWDPIEQVVADLYAAHAYAPSAGASFQRLQIADWPSEEDFSVSVESAVMQLLTALAQRGVQVDSEVAFGEDGSIAERFGLD